VHAPHVPCPQPNFVALSPSFSRSTSISIAPASTNSACSAPLTVKTSGTRAI
jgi:hypothetical protein